MRLGFCLALIFFVMALGPPDAIASDAMLGYQLEVLDVADLDAGCFALAPFAGMALEEPTGVDDDCDDYTTAPAMREPDHWRYLCDSTAGLHRCLMVQHSYLDLEQAVN